MTDRALSREITPAGAGQDEVAWNVLGHRYFLKIECEACFCFETYDPPGTLVSLHVHPKQDEFIYLLASAALWTSSVRLSWWPSGAGGCSAPPSKRSASRPWRISRPPRADRRSTPCFSA